MISKRATLKGAGALVAVAVAAGVGGCSSSGSDQSPSSAAPSSAPSSAEAHGDAHGGAHGDADVMFAQHMIPHHKQAVEMSDVLLSKQGVDPRVLDLAKQIKAAQGPEIEQMQGWLQQWGDPPPMNHADMPEMQGMVSEEDMTALKNAQGVQAAKLFLNHMIAHHEGAIAMAQDEIKDGRFPAAVAMARSIVTAQQQEIDTMRGILGTV